ALAVLAAATAEGGRRLDCFDTVLPGIYSQGGFKAVARIPFDEKYQPEDWSKKTFEAFNDGKPDVVFMVYDPPAKNYTKADGGTVTDYDAGVAKQTSELAKIDAAGSSSKGTGGKGEAVKLLEANMNPNATLESVEKEIKPTTLAAIKEAVAHLEKLVPTDAP